MTFPKGRRFFYHYNRPASARAGHPMMSVHVAGACHVARSVECLVPCSSHERAVQPRLVMAGTCNELVVTPDKIVIK